MAGVVSSPFRSLPLISRSDPKIEMYPPLCKTPPTKKFPSALPTFPLSISFTHRRHSSPLTFKASGYREKVFAIIGVKVYAAGFYARCSIRENLDAWKGKSPAEVLEDSSLFSSIFQAPQEKSLRIQLVRDVDGKTFWNALNDVLSPRVTEPTADDESALATFRNTFQGRDLMKGTLIFLTWVEPSKMLVSISSDEFPSNVDAKIESVNVTLALFDAFFGDSPVCPTLKASIANGLTLILN